MPLHSKIPQLGKHGRYREGWKKIINIPNGLINSIRKRKKKYLIVNTHTQRAATVFFNSPQKDVQIP